MIGRIVRRTRDLRGLTQAATASLARVRAEHLSRFERGQREMSTAALQRVLDVLDLVVVPREHADPSELEPDPPSLSELPTELA